MVKVKLSETGQLVLPQAILNTPQWGQGTEFVLWDTGREIIMKPVTTFPPSELEPPDTPSVYTDKPLSLEDMEKAIEMEAMSK